MKENQMKKRERKQLILCQFVQLFQVRIRFCFLLILKRGKKNAKKEGGERKGQDDDQDEDNDDDERRKRNKTF